MFCESFRAALSDAALRNERPRGDTEAHLARCASCRESFSQEQALSEFLDSELRSLANADVPPSLVAKVRRQIAGLPESRTRFSPLLTYAAAGLAVLTIVFALAVRSRVPLVQRQDLSREASASAPGEQNTPPSQNAPVRKLVVNHQPGSGRRRAIMQAQPEVLVAAEEQLGLQRYAASLNIAGAERPAVVKTNAATEITPLEIAGIDVRRLTIEPLESGDAN